MIIKIDNKDVNLPDFLIAGVSRSGTTSLYYSLKQHPQIFMPHIKEPFFFNGPYFKNYNVAKTAIDTIDKYIQLFAGSSEEIIGEATATYLYSFEIVIPNLKKLYGEKSKDLKIILLLRNPAERAFSQYKLFVRDACENLDFEKAIKADVIEARRDISMGYDYLGAGMYYNQVKAFLDNFLNVRIFLYECFKNNLMNVIKEIFRFLNVDDSFNPKITCKYNTAGKVKIKWLHEFVFFKRSLLKDLLKPFIPYELEMKIRHKILEKNTNQWEIPPDLKTKLLSMYKDDIHNLQRLLNMDLSIWLDK